MGVDKIASRIASLGVPGLVLIVAMSVSGFAGAAAITTALAALGGPLGMLGGIGMLGLLVIISNGLTEYGFEALFKRVVANLCEQGMTKEDILRKVLRYPISKSLKRTLKEAIEQQF